MVPKVENLKEKSSPTFGFSTLVFNFQIENLETNFWEGPKSGKLEKKLNPILGFSTLVFKLKTSKVLIKIEMFRLKLKNFI